jgi:hypothetical protein
MKKLFSAVALAAVGLFAAVGAASAQSVLTMTVKNSLPVDVNLSSTGCTGVISPTLAPLAAGQTAVYSAALTGSVAVSCQMTAKRVDNSRDCKWNNSRQKSTSTGPWNYPQVVTTTGSGLKCPHTITSVQTNGDWAVTLEIAPF